MLTLLITVLATAYFVVPEVLSRFVLGFFLIRKAMNPPKSEELMRGAFWAILPLLIAWSTRNWWDCTFPANATQSVKVVFTDLYSEASFAAHPADFFPAVATLARANMCLLVRAYLLVLMGSVVLGILTRKFGSVRAHVPRHSFLSKILHAVVLPRISEWHLALSPMLLDNPEQYSIEIDAMTKSGILYRGKVHEKNIASDGSLQTLILTSPDRFLHADFVRDRSNFEALPDKTNAAKPSTNTYWRKIPGELFYIVGSDITSVNVRHVSTMASVKPKEDADLQMLLDDLATQLKLRRSLM